MHYFIHNFIIKIINNIFKNDYFIFNIIKLKKINFFHKNNYFIFNKLKKINFFHKNINIFKFY